MAHLQHSCQYCGAALEISKAFRNIVKCDSCNRENIIKESSKGSRYEFNINRALEYRSYLQFNHAMRKYQEMLEEDPDDVDVLWGYLLSKYGIMYIGENPVIFKYDPGKIKDDRFYKRLEKAVKDRNHRYLIEIDKIDDLRTMVSKKIIEDKGYDVFISYKRSIQTESGTEAYTKESEYARAVYELLKDNGVDNIFFAQNTLKENPGLKWEAEIYMALKSAKVMILFASNEEWVESKWIKNEWTRFTKYIEADPSKVLYIVRTDGFPISKLHRDLTGFQDFDFQDIDFKEKILSYVTQKTKVGLSNIQKKEIKEIATRSVVKRDAVEIVTKKVGKSYVKDYKVKPSVDLKLRNTYALYINKGLFKKGEEELLSLKKEDQNDVRIDLALFLVKNHIKDIKELPNLKSISLSSFSYLESLIDGSAENEVKEYLDLYSKYLIESIRVYEPSKFIDFQREFNFILPWFEKSPRIKFTNALNEKIRKQIKEKLPSYDVFLYIEEVSKFIGDDEVDIYMNRFNNAAYQLVTTRQYEEARKCIEKVFKLDELHPRSLRIQFHIDYESDGNKGNFNKLSMQNLENNLMKMASAGAINENFFKSLYDGCFLQIRDHNNKVAFEVFKTLLSYAPNEINAIIKEDMPYFFSMAFYNKYWKESRDFVDFYLDLFPDYPYAHFIKYAYSIKASTISEILFIEKKSLLDNELFLNVVNSSEHNEEFIRFIELHDEFMLELKDSVRGPLLLSQRKSFKDDELVFTELREFMNKTYLNFDKNISDWLKVYQYGFKTRLKKKTLSKAAWVLMLFYLPTLPILMKTLQLVYNLSAGKFMKSVLLFLLVLIATPLWIVIVKIAKYFYNKDKRKSSLGAKIAFILILVLIVFLIVVNVGTKNDLESFGNVSLLLNEYFVLMPLIPVFIGVIISSLLISNIYITKDRKDELYGLEVVKIIRSKQAILNIYTVILAISVFILMYFTFLIYIW